MRFWLITKLSKLSITYPILNFFRDLYFSSRYGKYRNKYSIPKSFRFNGVDIELYGEGKIIVGEDSYIGNRSVLAASKNCSIIIGYNCAISHNVRIYTSNRNASDIIQTKETISIIEKNVQIGNNVWIGANVFITEGSIIGDNCVIGANAVVTKSFPSNVIIGGVPAKIIGKK